MDNCILTNMCMICDGDYVIVQRRNAPGWPGICFPGGHVEPCESFVDSVVREVKEETGLDIADVRLCGVCHWVPPDNDHRYIIFLYKTSTFSASCAPPTRAKYSESSSASLTQPNSATASPRCSRYSPTST